MRGSLSHSRRAFQTSNNPRQLLQGAPVFEAFLLGFEQHFARVPTGVSSCWRSTQSGWVPARKRGCQVFCIQPPSFRCRKTGPALDGADSARIYRHSPVPNEVGMKARSDTTGGRRGRGSAACCPRELELPSLARLPPAQRRRRTAISVPVFQWLLASTVVFCSRQLFRSLPFRR